LLELDNSTASSAGEGAYLRIQSRLQVTDRLGLRLDFNGAGNTGGESAGTLFGGESLNQIGSDVALSAFHFTGTAGVGYRWANTVDDSTAQWVFPRFGITIEEIPFGDTGLLGDLAYRGTPFGKEIDNEEIEVLGYEVILRMRYQPQILGSWYASLGYRHEYFTVWAEPTDYTERVSLLLLGIGYSPRPSRQAHSEK
jgi:hypothetical protein